VGVWCRMQIGEEPMVRTAANVFREMCYNYRDQLSAGIICAGWDRKEGGQVCWAQFINQKLLKKNQIKH
jgi:20S proteasome alpha/beta subunit